MKPIKLIIQAFGPFAHTETINFSALGNNPLFLINGPTGAGKSSILDAICFALYGQTTGKDREAVSMRCDFSKPELLTKVSLEFSLGEQRYQVERLPTQNRPKTKGEGFTTQQTSAILYKLDDDENKHELLEAKLANKTTTLIETLTGLNVEQFRQVMVLPQGKFRDFLMADSTSREAIFSKLFQTQIYKRVEDQLKSQSSEIRKAVEGLRNQIKGILDTADIINEDQLKACLLNLEEELIVHLQAKELQQTNLLKAQSKLQNAITTQAAFTQLEQSKKQQLQLIEQENVIQDKVEQLDNAKKSSAIKAIQQQLQQQRNHVKLAEENIAKNTTLENTLASQLRHEKIILDTAQIKAETLDKEKIERAQLESYLPLQAQLDVAKQKFLQAEKEKNRSEKNQVTLHDALANNKQLSTEKNTQIKSIQTQLLALADLQLKVDKLKRLGTKRAALDTLHINKQKNIEVQATAAKKLLSINEKIEQKTQTTKALELQWHTMQASILALELHQGQACPVCGSTVHPSPAPQDKNNNLTKDDIEAARQLTLQLIEQRSAIEAQLASLTAQIEQTEYTITEHINELGEYAQLSTDTMREQYQTANTQLKYLQEQQALLQQFSTQVNELSHTIQTQESQLEKLQEQHQATTQAYTIETQALAQLEITLPENLRNANALTTAIANKTQLINTISLALTTAESSLQKTQVALTQTQSALTEQRKQLNLEQSQTEVLVQQWQQSLSKQGFLNTDVSELKQAEADFNASLLSEASCDKLEGEIKTFEHQRSGIAASIKQQEATLHSQEVSDLEAFEAEKAEQEKRYEAALEAWSNSDKRLQQLRAVQIKLDTAKNNNAKLEAEYKIIGTLSDVANGQTGNKISLQRFVLSVLLDDVLVEASQRLQLMSKGRYQLLRKQDRAKGNKASGLELEVEDAYTGKNRPVTTLSGGESFMAALALALGLSDVVQAYAGGIKLETLFIDEGFGSLDQESLDLAIRTLIDLQASGRMIGVISHVSELKEQMALRVDVNQTGNSSEVVVLKG